MGKGHAGLVASRAGKPPGSNHMNIHSYAHVQTISLCYVHILPKAAPLIRTGNLNGSELHQYWVE